MIAITHPKVAALTMSIMVGCRHAAGPFDDSRGSGWDGFRREESVSDGNRSV